MTRQTFLKTYSAEPPIMSLGGLADWRSAWMSYRHHRLATSYLSLVRWIAEVAGQQGQVQQQGRSGNVTLLKIFQPLSLPSSPLIIVSRRRPTCLKLEPKLFEVALVLLAVLDDEVPANFLVFLVGMSRDAWR